jgi:hypothetical protein
MTQHTTTLSRTVIPPHHPHYWASRKIAFAAIRALEKAHDAIKRAPLYICFGYDEDGAPLNITENIGPFDALSDAQNEVVANPNAVSILEAQKRRHLIDPSGF